MPVPPGAVSPTGQTIYGVEIPLVAMSRVPNAVALVYTAGAVLIMRACNLFVSGPKFSSKYFPPSVGGVVVDQVVFRFF